MEGFGTGRQRCAIPRFILTPNLIRFMYHLYLFFAYGGQYNIYVGIYLTSSVLLLKFGTLYNTYSRLWREVNLVFDSFCDAAANLEVAWSGRKSGRFFSGPLRGAGTTPELLTQVTHRCRSVFSRQTGGGLPTPPSQIMSNELKLEHHKGGGRGAR